MTTDEFAARVFLNFPWAKVATSNGGMTITHPHDAGVTANDCQQLASFLSLHGASFGTWDFDGNTYSLRVTMPRQP